MCLQYAKRSRVDELGAQGGVGFQQAHKVVSGTCYSYNYQTLLFTCNPIVRSYVFWLYSEHLLLYVLVHWLLYCRGAWLYSEHRTGSVWRCPLSLAFPCRFGIPLPAQRLGPSGGRYCTSSLLLRQNKKKKTTSRPRDRFELRAFFASEFTLLAFVPSKKDASCLSFRSFCFQVT